MMFIRDLKYIHTCIRFEKDRYEESLNVFLRTLGRSVIDENNKPFFRARSQKKVLVMKCTLIRSVFVFKSSNVKYLTSLSL